MGDRVEKTEDEWKAQLTPEQFRVARMKGTERASTGVYNDEKRPGLFRCVCCGNPLFRSEAKYDSGSGWPSFSDMVEQGRVRTETDTSLGRTRVEVLCVRCDAHLGHVFDDGPKPTGLRYCVNSASLQFEPEPEE